LHRHYTLVKLFLLIAWLVGLTTIAVADRIPLPRPRPAEFKTAPDAAPPNAEEPAESDEKKPEAAEAAPPAPPPPSACFVRLQQLAVVHSLPAINKPGGCIANDVVQLDAVLLADKRQVAMEPAATFRCEMASAITDWVRDELAAAAMARFNSPLRAVENLASFDCRGRNNIPGALLSEHGKANALDVRALKLVDGTVAQLTDPNVSKELRDELRKTACARFKTVLGPGSDGYHEDHVHVDLAERKSDYRLCQWEVRQPIYRALPSPHIVSYGKPSPHVAGPSAPAAPVAAAAKTDDKARPAQRKL
jgi:hypothetical protein